MLQSDDDAGCGFQCDGVAFRGALVAAGGGQCPFAQVLRNSLTEFRLLPLV